MFDIKGRKDIYGRRCSDSKMEWNNKRVIWWRKRRTDEKKDNLEIPLVLKVEVSDDINHMMKGKATGPDEITIDELAVLGEFGIEILNKLTIDIYKADTN